MGRIRTSLFEDLVRVLARERKRFRHLTQQFQDLGNVVIVLVVLSPWLRVKQVVARQ